MRNTGTVYQSKGRWYTGNFVRFFQDTIQPIGGWLARSLTGATIAGTPNAALAWTPDRVGTAQAPVMAIGTTTGLYVVSSANVVYDITPSDVVSAGNNANRIWSLDVFGAYLIATATTKGNYATSLGPYRWECDTAVAAVLMSGAPIRPQAIVTTPERFVVMLGGVDPNPEFATVPSSRTVFWPSQESTTDWTPVATNSAGSFNLTTEGSLVCGVRVRGSTLLFTTIDLHSMNYIGAPLYYSFDRVGMNCGIISAHAAVVTDTAVFWMGQQQFFMFDGFAKPIPCDLHDYVFGSFNRDYAHLVWALSNPAFGEVTWWYPSAASTVPDRYVTYNYMENHWVPGDLTRTCGVTSIPPAAVPVLVNDSRQIFDHETGFARNSEGTPSLESGPMEIGDGDQLMSIQGLFPDDKTVGDVSLTLYTAPNPDTAETANGPYTLTAQTSLRVKARQVRVKLTEAAATAWRVGVLRFSVSPSGRR